MTLGLRRRRLAPVVLMLALAAVFTLLGGWQLQRRAWKLQLIEDVEARIHAPPQPAPPPSRWRRISPRDAYRRVRVHGAYLGPETLVQAVTELGGGSWVLSPLRTDAGWTVLVNRGFVPPERRGAAAHAPPAGVVAVTGLLRTSEPGGGFLRRNAPGEGRWYSRDVAAIIRAQGLGPAAPYFIDAEAAPDPSAFPVGGLTVVRFPNSHLAYALTWFALAALSLAGAWVVGRTGGPGARSGPPLG